MPPNGSMRAVSSSAPIGGAKPHAPSRPRTLRLRLVILGFVPLALATGLAGGLARLGWDMPGGARLAELHALLMVSGLFGTLIGLERAVALGKGWVYAAPILSTLATVALLAGVPQSLAAALYLAAAGILAIATAIILRAQPAVFTVALLLGALSWGAGIAFWLAGEELPRLAGWWIAFLLLTIGGERLEMSRVLPPRRGSQALFAVSVGLILAGALGGITGETGARLYGLGLLACAFWLLRHDVARRNVRAAGTTRYFAACMLAGYAWLFVAGALLISAAASGAAFGFDMALHAVLIGFVLSMVFGHALIILPAVTRIRVDYGPLLYLPLAVLHGSLALRIVGGLLQWNSVRQWSGIGTVLAILLFAASLMACRSKSRRS